MNNMHYCSEPALVTFSNKSFSLFDISIDGEDFLILSNRSNRLNPLYPFPHHIVKSYKYHRSCYFHDEI